MASPSNSTDTTADRRLMLTRAWLAAAGLILMVSATALGGWAFALGNDPFEVDVWWNAWLLDWESAFMLAFSQTMNFIGGGWFSVFVVPLVGALALVLDKRRWAAVYLLASLAASALMVQLLKHLFARGRPEEILILSDFGSYPSGHVANAATLAVVALVIYPRVWVFIVGAVWVVLMAISRTYLHAHWLSDTLGGACIGGGVALLVGAMFVGKLAAESRRRSGGSQALADTATQP
ncbi:phosphatase PAP2 family protein [Microbacterium sp. C7(2022)]|uniref:phosphatase PAP2 family protein n=1 Tax=Microbacterium sp. C7(2022) TaxID=2992759 RepID=UPI00237B88AD|nr:phosphatase PAP2 family protein [Microbacterium sp. C7(2022)]MDE0546078.1 phosphatase PAP2 family protein [Microbacterium sp. C7(2022)]